MQNLLTNNTNKCVKCGNMYINIKYKWCETCQITSWTSGNKDIDNLIQEIQLKINCYIDIMFEWISCNQFDRIKEISNAVYSTIWKFSPLNWNIKELIKKSNRIVALKVYLYNEVLKGLNKVRNFIIK